VLVAFQAADWLTSSPIDIYSHTHTHPFQALLHLGIFLEGVTRCPTRPGEEGQSKRRKKKRMKEKTKVSE
jgi:hypothetical protein